MYKTKKAKPTAMVAHIPPAGVKVWPDQPSQNGEETKPLDASQAWRTKQRRVKIGLPGHRVNTVGQVIAMMAGAWCVVLLLFLAWWKPHLGFTGGATGLGLLFGVLYSYLYYNNCKAKLQNQQVLSMDPGLKGCQYLLGTLPSWINLTEREKMEWWNRMLSEMWPYYDRGVCAMVKEIVEPIIEMYRPPVFKKIFFEELTFGEAPIRVEGITVKDSKDEIDMEIDVRWSGDANISLGIDLPLGGEFTRLTPKVKDIIFVATFKVILKPLVDKVPGFAAAAVAFESPPIIKYRLDFGVVPSTITAIVTAPLRALVDQVIGMVIGWYTWPGRFTVPLLGWNGWMPANDPEIDLEIERLNGRQQGVVKVHVIRAKDLKSYDTLGKSDPFVEIYTTADHHCETQVINNSLTPEWNELHYLPVLEKDTILRLEMFDHDTVNIGSITSLANIKDTATMKGSKEFMGRCCVPLAQYVTEEGLEDEFWVPLGRGEWTNLGGPGQGEGWIKLGLQYRAVENIAGEEILRAQQGLLLVGVIRCYELGGLGQKSQLTSYVTVTVKKAGKDSNKKVYKTPVIKSSNNPRWAGENKFTLYNVDKNDTLVVTAMEPSLTIDDEIGKTVLPVTQIIGSRQVSRWTKEEQAGYIYKEFPLYQGEGGSSVKGRIELEIEFLPYW